jgi:hypothetical protein
MIQTIRNILAAAYFAPFAIMVIVAIAGAVVSLIGALAGSESVTEFGKVAAALGALGFFGWLFLLMTPVGQILLELLPTSKAPAQHKAVAGKKENK